MSIHPVDFFFTTPYFSPMAQKTALSSAQRTSWLQVRITPAERAAFSEAARLTGLSVSGWMRSMGRQQAIAILRSAGKDKAVEALTK